MPTLPSLVPPQDPALQEEFWANYSREYAAREHDPAAQAALAAELSLWEDRQRDGETPLGALLS